jgi:ABC-type antimicrobial peptide transport system permease subunit
LDDARRLFGSRFGDTNTLRLRPPSGVELADLADRAATDLPRRAELLEAGMTVQALKGQGLQAARGATDFGMLFFGFSMFLIVSSALLVALFFRLGVEQRASELGLRLATGTSVRRVRRIFLTEGLLLAVVGALLGLALAVAYAALMLTALETLWIGAVGSSFLELHVGPATLPLAFALSILVILFAIWRAVRRLADLSVISLLRGSTRPAQLSPRGGGKAAKRRPVFGSSRIALAAAGLALVLFVASTLVAQSQAPILFFGVGAALLVCGLAVFSGWLGGAMVSSGSEGDVKALSSSARMALANAETSAGRTLLSVALVAAASFVIVAVGSYGLSFGEEVRERDSGAGGFPLIAHADVSLHHDLNRAEGRFEVGFSDQDSELLAQSVIVPLRSVPGDDVSCLNLFQPERPGLLGVPPELIARGGFSFTAAMDRQDLVEQDAAPAAGDDGAANPWSLLDVDLGPDVIPAFGDNNSVLWILKSGLGKDVEMVNEAGETIRLRLVGLLRKSIFQSDLLISERALLEHFPSRSGYQSFLIDTPLAQESQVIDTLESSLERYGFDVQSTAQLLQSYQAVENTYLSTFQTLGGLGLLLGTLGLAVILLRNVIERRAELATLRALGFRRRRLGWLVVLENTLALLAGVVIGTLAALVAVSPHLLESNASVPWLSLAVTLLLVLAVGTLASIAAVRAALRTPLLPALRSQ